MPTRTTRTLLAILAAALPAASAMCADDAKPAATPTTTVGMRATIDPQTGKLVQPPPGAAKRKLPVPGLEPDDSKLEVVHHPDGSIQVLFHGQRQATVYATLDANGAAQTQCIEGTAQLPTPAAKPDEHDHE